MDYFERKLGDNNETRNKKRFLNGFSLEELLSFYNEYMGSGYDEIYTKDSLYEILKIMDGREGFDSFDMLAASDPIDDDHYYGIGVYHNIEHYTEGEVISILEDYVDEIYDMAMEYES